MFFSPSWSFSFIHSFIHTSIHSLLSPPLFPHSVPPSFSHTHLFFQTSPSGSLRQEVLQLQLSAKALKGNSSDPWPRPCVLLKDCPQALWNHSACSKSCDHSYVTVSQSPLTLSWPGCLLIICLSAPDVPITLIAFSFSFCCTLKAEVLSNFWTDWPCTKPFFVLQEDKNQLL